MQGTVTEEEVLEYSNRLFNDVDKALDKSLEEILDVTGNVPFDSVALALEKLFCISLALAAERCEMPKEVFLEYINKLCSRINRFYIQKYPRPMADRH